MVIIALVFSLSPILYGLFVLSFAIFLVVDDDYEVDEDGDLTDVDSELDESFYGPKISRTKSDLKKDGEVVDTNFLAWLATMKEMNEGSDEEWKWNGEGW